MAGMMGCPNCGKLTDPKLENCPHCGYIQQQSQAPRPHPERKQARGHTCPNCHASVSDGDIICVACGTNLLTGQKIAAEAKREATETGRGVLFWILTGVVIVVVVVAVAVAVYLMTRDPLQQALELSRAGNLLEATDVLDAYLADHPDDANAYFLLGRIFWKANKFRDAAGAFEKAKKRPKAGLMAVLCLATLTGEDTLARQVAILRDLPQTPETARLRALALGAQGNFKDQVEAAREVAESIPDDPDAQLDLAIAYALNKLYGDATRQTDTATAQGANAGDAAAVGGFVAYSQGDMDTAAARLAAALEQDTSIRREVLTRLGLILVAQGRFNEAASYWKEVIDMGGQTRVAKFFHGICLAARGATDEAIRQFEEVAQQQGSMAVEANIQLAHLCLEQNDTERARQAVERAAGYGGSGPVLDTLRGRVEARAGQIREAQDAFKRAIQADPTYAPAHLENGLAYVKREVFTEGARELERYLSLVDTQAAGTRAPEIEALVDQLKQTTGGDVGTPTVTTAVLPEGRSR